MQLAPLPPGHIRIFRLCLASCNNFLRRQSGSDSAVTKPQQQCQQQQQHRKRGFAQSSCIACIRPAVNVSGKMQASYFRPVLSCGDNLSNASPNPINCPCLFHSSPARSHRDYRKESDKTTLHQQEPVRASPDESLTISQPKAQAGQGLLHILDFTEAKQLPTFKSKPPTVGNEEKRLRQGRTDGSADAHETLTAASATLSLRPAAPHAPHPGIPPFRAPRGPEPNGRKKKSENWAWGIICTHTHFESHPSVTQTWQHHRWVGGGCGCPHRPPNLNTCRCGPPSERAIKVAGWWSWSWRVHGHGGGLGVAESGPEHESQKNSNRTVPR